MLEPLKLLISCQACEKILELTVYNTVKGWFLGTRCTRCSDVGVIRTINSKFYASQLEAATAYDLLVASDLTVLIDDPVLGDLHAQWSMQIIAHRASQNRDPGITGFEEGFQALLRDDDDAGAAKLLYDNMAKPEERRKYALYLLKECLTMARIAGALNERGSEKRDVG